MIGKLAGYEKKELIGMRFSSLGFISKELKPLPTKHNKDRMAGSSLYEVKIKTKSGEIKCLKVKGNRFINEGELLDLTIFHDVTEEDKIQNELGQSLFESEEKFHGITNSIKEAVIVVNDEAKVTYWNPAAEKIFDYTNEEATGKDIHRLVVPKSMCQEVRDRIAISVKTFTQTGMGYFTVGNVELVGRRKDGSEFPVELSISPTKFMGKWSAVAVVKDITKRKQAEQKLRDAEQRYHAIFNQAPLGVLVVDPETARVVEFNDVAHQLLCYSREEF
jgi:PAS domain S-box-containing protein